MNETPAPKRKRKSTGGGNRLDAENWIDAALDDLGEHGIERVRVELLAKKLNVTKGSFYYHFKDRDALLEQMLERWRRRATVALIERLDSVISSPRERLHQLLRLPHKGEAATLAANVELAIRLWGRIDPRAQRALKEVDDLRLRYIAQLMVQSGASEEVARARAILAYSYQRVAATLIARGDEAMFDQCEALLLP